MSEMVERVAVALFSHYMTALPDNATAIARIAIAAMREPTEAMIEAAKTNHWTCDGETGMDGVWRDMIDAALK
jgi:hypothetical protein